MSSASADPKGPLPLDDGNGPKKASKKSSSKRAGDGGQPTTTPSPAVSQLSSTVISTTPNSPVPALHDVPRLAIADPKGIDGVGDPGTGKVRAAKKRTSTTEATTPGPSMPTASDGPPAAAKNEADAEKERAKREAKKQRARELDEQRKRDDLERQALDEARRKDEQRQRDLRRQQDQAQLNANADVVQEEDDDGYGDDGFEDYGDDFENDDAPPTTARAKTLAKEMPKAKGMPREADAPALSSTDLKRIQEAQKAESKELLSSSSLRPSSKASSKSTIEKTAAAGEAKKHATPATSIAASIAGLKQSLDPRAKRAREIREHRRFDVEKFNVFVQAPMVAVDMYLARLRRGNIRQVAAQTKDDDKSVATQTRVPELVDHSMHFPDDVGIDDVTARLTARGKRRDNQSEADSPEEEEDEVDEGTTISSMRFLNFLEQSSQVCEQLIQETIQEHESNQTVNATSRGTPTVQLSSKAVLSRNQLFPTKKFDQPGLERLLSGRALTLLQFSPGMSNLLITWHSTIATTDSPAEVNHTPGASPIETLFTKSIACVWDINDLAEALYVLQCEDSVTTCCLSPTRDLIVLAGTQDGSVNVWDLRSRLALAGRSFSTSYDLDLFAPTYSTCGADSRSIEGSHQSPIVSIDVIERQGGSMQGTGVFQFGSLDDRGLLLIWSMVDYANARDADTLLTDKCLAIGGHIKLVVSVVIDTQLQYLVLTRPRLRSMVWRDPTRLADLASARTDGNVSSTNTNRRSTIGNSSSARKKTVEDALAAELNVGPIATLLLFFPEDPNQFLIGTTTGLVLRANRFQQTRVGGASVNRPFSDTHGGAPQVDCYRRDHSNTVAAPVPVGIAVTSIAFNPFGVGSFLVGYADGRICLFDAGLTVAVATWENVAYDTSVTTLQWSPSRPVVFFASYSDGLVQAWDLTAQQHAPSFEYQLATRKGIVPGAYPLTLSSERMRTSRPSIAMGGDDTPFEFQVHELGAEFTTRGHDKEQAVQQILASIF